MSLSWSEVDPDRTPFSLDADAQDELAAAVLALGPPVGASGDRYEFVGQVTDLLVGRYGVWACGWHWAVGEGGGGGPVQSWCCAGHSLREGPEAASRAVVESLLEWRAWAERLAERFVELAPVANATGEDRSWAIERAAVRLVTTVLDATSGACGWHHLCCRTLSWYLASVGIEGERAARLVEDAIGGRFESWTAPGFAVVGAVCEDLALGVTGHRTYREH
ncbi:hypothetical protein ACFYST_04035 [Kitasatospora sp. NPDC004614]|uniref:hypothetical protein n=1 Tax=unclassified Kitasatospora TaxID=2633591 RepID=UPI00368BB584